MHGDFTKVETNFSEDLTQTEVLIPNNGEEASLQDAQKKDCKYCISVNYPVTIQNCLPNSLGLKFLEKENLSKGLWTEGGNLKSESNSNLNFQPSESGFIKKINVQYIFPECLGVAGEFIERKISPLN
jgi:hypothetical protein